MSRRQRVSSRGQCNAVAAAFAVVMLAGCSGGDPGSEDPAAEVASSTDATPAVSAAEIELVAVDRAGLDERLAALHGQVVLVDYWASWCAPCLQELPHTVKLAEQLGDKGLTCITVAMEDPADSERLAKVLAKRDAGATTNLVSQLGGGSPAMEAFEIDGGALPHYKLYDRQGKLRETFGLDPSAETQYTTAEIDAEVDRLLAEPGA